MLMSISGIYALTNETVNTGISTGFIDIDINTYELNNERQEVAYGSQKATYMPGDSVSLIPKISNLGSDCYIRVKVEYVNTETKAEDYILGASKDFEKHGDYYYYHQSLKKDEVIKLFDSIKVPENIDGKTDNRVIELKITVQAIQEKNFEPDYTLSDPWKNEKPIESINASYPISDKGDKGITIKFENGTEEDVKVPSDFMKDLTDILPGDSFEDTIEIKNNGEKEAKYYLKYKTEEMSEKEKEIFKQLNITITDNEGKVIYDGKIADINSLLLGKYDVNESEKLKFNLSIPSELKNGYENMSPKLTLIIEKDNSDLVENPKTGDYLDASIIVFLSSAIGLITVMLLSYIQKRKEK